MNPSSTIGLFPILVEILFKLVNDFKLKTNFIEFILGGGVVTTRAHVHYIVTEYGIAYLFGKNLRQRAYELIKIAHPDHRDWLEKAAYERLKCMPSPD